VEDLNDLKLLHFLSFRLQLVMLIVEDLKMWSCLIFFLFVCNWWC
jgi:hypothetical protein